VSICRFSDAVAKFDHQEAYDKMWASHNFFDSRLPVSTTYLEKYFTNGFMYFLNRDKKYRPVLIIDLQKVIDTGKFLFHAEGKSLNRYR
jgi:ATP-dependent helicase/DNAse subunit B